MISIVRHSSLTTPRWAAVRYDRSFHLGLIPPSIRSICRGRSVAPGCSSCTFQVVTHPHGLAAEMSARVLHRKTLFNANSSIRQPTRYLFDVPKRLTMHDPLLLPPKGALLGLVQSLLLLVSAIGRVPVDRLAVALLETTRAVPSYLRSFSIRSTWVMIMRRQQ